MVMANIPRAVVALSLTLLLVLSPLCSAYSVLKSGEGLRSEQYLSWKSYGFVMQHDCNLVLYNTGKPLWASNTGGLGKDCYVTLEYDANLVIYNGNDDVIWASNTKREEGFYALILKKDGNVVISGGSIWWTSTWVGGSRGIAITSNASTKVGSLPANATHASNASAIAMLVNN